jgi:hypothetical protein
MATKKDALDLVRQVLQVSEAFGMEEEFSTEFRRRLDLLVDCMGADYNMGISHMISLPSYMPLGERAEKCLGELKQWLSETYPKHFDFLTAA